MPLTTIFVEVLTSVTELVRIEENASGMRSFDALTAGLLRDAENHRQKECGRGGVADERADARRGEHHDPEQPVGIGAGVAQDRAPGELDHAGAFERRGEDEQAEDHDDRVAAEARERLLRGQQAR